jgi:hypothetical protein
MVRAPWSLPLLCSGSLLAQADAGGFEARVAAALERARPALIRDLERVDGDALALVCLAARHHGMGIDDEAFGQALAKLARRPMVSTYGLSLRLMLLADCPDVPQHGELLPRDATALLDRRGGGGGFSYGSADGWWDLSNTQYAALGLRAAASLGFAVPRGVWRALLAEVMRGQKSDGGFSYRPDQGRSSAYSSMTVAGIAVLEICRQQIELDNALAADVGRAIDAGWKWMGEHKADIGDRSVRSSLYFHYGLERAAILSQRDDVDGVDWYRVGAEMLIGMQKRSGGFLGRSESRSKYSADGSRGNPIDTAFAVLFLKRKFARVLGPTTQTASWLSLALPAQATDTEIDLAADAEVRRGLHAVPDLLRAMRSEHRSRRTAAAKALLRLSGRSFDYHPARTVEQNGDGLRQAERWWLSVKDR